MLAAPPPLPDYASLFLDFDGTLAELADTPDAVVVAPGLHDLLSALAERLAGKLAIVSGRDVATLRDLLGFDGFVLSGSHGLEIASPGRPPEHAEPSPALPEIAAALDALAAAHEGLLVERKPLGIGLHYRRRPELETVCRETAAKLAEQHGLKVQHGKMIAEIRPGSADKGSAIRTLMERVPFAGGVPVFLGDDVTDEDGFEAVSALGGHGVLIGEERETAAGFRLSDVAAVHGWLRQQIT